MSSHHVVREKQEPALLVLGLDRFQDELLGQLLEWSPTVITTGKTAETIHTFGIKIDWVIAHELTAPLQSDIKLLPAGDDSFTEAALKYLVTRGYPAVNIITDELQLKDFLYFTDKINLVIFYQHKKIFPVKSGFSQWKPAGELIEILTQPHQLKFSGLEALGSNLYKTKHDGFYTLHFDTSFLFLQEEL